MAATRSRAPGCCVHTYTSYHIACRLLWWRGGERGTTSKSSSFEEPSSMDGLLPAAAISSAIDRRMHASRSMRCGARGCSAAAHARGWCARLCAAAARAAPRAKKQLAPQFYLVQFTGFYKYLKLFFSHTSTCAQYPTRPESAIKIP